MRDVLILGVGRAVQALGGLATIRIGTELLSPQTMGYVGQAIAIVTLLGNALLAPVSIYVGRGLLGWIDAGCARLYLVRFFWFVVVGATLAGSFVFFVRSAIPVVQGIPATGLAVITVVYMIASPLFSAGSTCLNLLGHRAIYVAFSNLSVWGGLVLAIIFFVLFSTPAAWILGLYLGLLAAGYAFFVALTITEREPVGASRSSLPFERHAVFQFAWPLFLSAVLWWSTSMSYRFVLADVSKGAAVVGLFLAGYSLCSGLMQTFVSLFNEIYSPTFYRALTDHNPEKLTLGWNEYASAYIPAIIVFGAFLGAASPYLVTVLLAREYQAIAPVLFLPALTETIQAASAAVSMVGIAKADFRLNTLPILAAAILSPTLVYFLAGVNGLWGTAIALLVAYLVVLVLSTAVGRRQLPISWPKKRIFFAAVLIMPMCLAGAIIPRQWATSFPTAIAVLGAGFVYMMGAQYVMARPWLRRIAMIRHRA